jgi:hypothetical protein
MSQILVIDTLSCFGSDGTIAPEYNWRAPVYKHVWRPPVNYFLDYLFTTDTSSIL